MAWFLEKTHFLSITNPRWPPIQDKCSIGSYRFFFFFFFFYLKPINHLTVNIVGMLLVFSHFWDRPIPIFSDVRFSYFALVQNKITCVLPANACRTVYVNFPPPSQFSMHFLFKLNNSLYISFQSFINTQILTISHIIT